MLSLPIGFFLLVGFLVLSTPLNSWGLYVNSHSMMIVLGGTVGILAFATPSLVLKNLLKAIGDLFRKDPDLKSHKAELERLIQDRTLSRKSSNELINYAAELWQAGTSQEMFQVLISQKKDKLENQMLDAIQALRNLAKYPPALGMTGTVMGLVSLFSNLNAENKDKLGPALGLAMTATFFGLITANALLMPLADRLQVAHLRRKEYYTSIYQVLLLINRREPDMLILGEVNERAAA
jgi:chemotaxis protein MotA